jgi:hypothetical protein
MLVLTSQASLVLVTMYVMISPVNDVYCPHTFPESVLIYNFVQLTMLWRSLNDQTAKNKFDLKSCIIPLRTNNSEDGPE